MSLFVSGLKETRRAAVVLAELVDELGDELGLLLDCAVQAARSAVMPASVATLTIDLRIIREIPFIVWF